MELFQLSFSNGVPVYLASIRWVAQWYPSVHWVNQWHSSGTPVYTGQASEHWLRVRDWKKVWKRNVLYMMQLPFRLWKYPFDHMHITCIYMDICILTIRIIFARKHIWEKGVTLFWHFFVYWNPWPCFNFNANSFIILILLQKQKVTIAYFAKLPWSLCLDM